MARCIEAEVISYTKLHYQWIFTVLQDQFCSQCKSIAYKMRLLCLSQTLSQTPNSDMSCSIATGAISPVREWGQEKQYDNSECTAVIMVFMKRWNWVQTKSVAPGKINSLALRCDPDCLEGTANIPKLCCFFHQSGVREWSASIACDY